MSDFKEMKEQAEKMEEGRKDDSEKVRMDLLSSSWLEGTSRVLTFGAKKYAAHNWRQGIANSRLIGAALRHIIAFNGGEDNDPETNLLHLYHASCCLMFASELHFTRPDLDDRYKGPEGATGKDASPSLEEEKEVKPEMTCAMLRARLGHSGVLYQSMGEYQLREVCNALEIPYSV